MLKCYFNGEQISYQKLGEYKDKYGYMIFVTTHGSYIVDVENVNMDYTEPRQPYYAIKLTDCICNLSLVPSVIINKQYLVSIEERKGIGD